MKTLTEPRWVRRLLIALALVFLIVSFALLFGINVLQRRLGGAWAGKVVR